MLDFTKLEKPEGLTDEMLADGGVQSFVQGMIDSQKTAAVSQITAQLDTATQAKVIADQKITDLRTQIEAGKKAKPSDNKEHTAELEALNTQLSDKGGEISKLMARLDKADVMQYLNGQIAAYHAANPTVKIVSGLESYVLDEALAAFKKNESGQIVPMKGDTVLTGTNGFMTGAEFITQLRTDKPGLFVTPSGGGASGSNNGGAGSKEMTRTAFDRLPPMEQGKIAQTHTIID